MAYLNDSLVLDDVPIDTIPPDRYAVFVQFTVDENGKLSNVSILKEPRYVLVNRFKKVILNYYGIWKAVIDAKGRVVAIYRKQPITFVVEKIVRNYPKRLRFNSHTMHRITHLFNQ